MQESGVRAEIVVIGKDKSGVIARITSHLFEDGANIEALEEQALRGEFSMTIQAYWEAEGWNEDRLRAGLEKLGDELGMSIRLRVIPKDGAQRMAILVTRETHCLDALLDGIQNGQLKVKPTVVISNHSYLQERAEDAGIPFVRIPWTDRAEAETATLELLERFEIDFLVLARFMKILSPRFVWRYKNKIINIHPSLLPSFPGPQAYRQAYEHGVKIMGVTAHFVDMRLDEGPIIAQSAFEVPPNATLKKIIQQGQRCECEALNRAVQSYIDNRLDVQWGVVKEV